MTGTFTRDAGMSQCNVAPQHSVCVLRFYREKHPGTMRMGNNAANDIHCLLPKTGSGQRPSGGNEPDFSYVLGHESLAGLDNGRTGKAQFWRQVRDIGTRGSISVSVRIVPLAETHCGDVAFRRMSQYRSLSRSSIHCTMTFAITTSRGVLTPNKKGSSGFSISRPV
jgi:hypothetical protein